MRRFLLLTASILSLASCGGTQLAYDLNIDVEEKSDITTLTLTSIRVIERRLAGLEAQADNLRFSTDGDMPRITLSVDTPETAQFLTDDLTAPFSFRIMGEAPEADADLVVEGHGGFKATGITEAHVEWAEAVPEPEGKGRVRLLFTPEGRTLMEQVFAEHAGKNIGVVVRNRLIAKIMVDTGVLREDIVISGVPSIDLARVFADDVNVGLHVTFTPVP